MSSTVDGAVAPLAGPGQRRPARRRTGGLAGRPRGGRWAGWLFALPAAVLYAIFVIRPVATSIQLSLYEWDGFGPSTWVGLANYQQVFTDPELLATLGHAFYFIIFFTVIPVLLGLVIAALMREIRGRVLGATARTLLFLPQIIPGAAAAIAWTWMYSRDGAVNQLLSAVGLDSITRAWLGDFTWALTAVAFIGTWLSTGLCTLLLMAGIGKIDASLYEAASLDGANAVQQFRAVTLPGLRQEIGVCVTITIIAALAAFDVVFLSTQGGPGRQTMVPGVEIYRLGFVEDSLGLASALAVVLTALILIVVGPLQRVFKEQ